MIGARGEDVEQLAGFREGPLPAGWADQLRQRAELPRVAVEPDVLCTEALEPLRAYAASGRAPYNPGTSQGCFKKSL